MLKFSTPTWGARKPRRWQPEAMDAIQSHMTQDNPEPVVISAIMGAGKSMLIEELCACAELYKSQVVVVSTSTQDLVEDLHKNIRIRCGSKYSVGVWYGRKKKLGRVIVTCNPSVGSLAEKLRSVNCSVALWIADEVHRSETASVLNAHACLAPAHAVGMTATPFRSDGFESITLFKKLIYRYGVSDAQKDKVIVPWRIVNYDGDSDDLDKACIEMIRQTQGPGLVNASNIEDANAYAKLLSDSGIPTKSIHSKQSSDARRKILQNLKEGFLRCVIHINLLTEGANYPWLRWLCLRRQVDAKVRFVQEIGRLLRSDSGKEEAIFLDPHDLFGSFHLTYAEALGEAPIRPEWEGALLPPEEMAERIMNSDPPVAMAWIESLIRSLAVAADAMGLLKSRKLIKKADRLKPSTDLQRCGLTMSITTIGELIPQGWIQCLDTISNTPGSLRFGFAADLLALLDGVKRSRKWPLVDSTGRISAAVGDAYITEPNGQMAVNFKNIA